MPAKNNIRETIKQLVIDAVNSNKDQIINKIANQKQIMFDNNSHDWSSLLPQTVSRKKRDKDLFRTPASINIRKGGLFKVFTNACSYKVTSSNGQIDFDIQLDDFEQFKTDIVASHGRSVTDVTQNELNQISENLANIISEAIKQHTSVTI
ncbi:MAG: hypothetical protein K0R49_65 [Burkholderiales bacterium]|jgi:hypothetical protein|nr:hypothetical protein [Burkholderiales bacterium]